MTDFEQWANDFRDFYRPFNPDEYNTAKKAFAAGRESAMQWLPIESAPKDSKARLVYCPENQCIFCVSFDARDGRWIYFGGNGTLFHKPTHWMPLPGAPK